MRTREGILEQKVLHQPNLVKENEVLEIVKSTLGELNKLSEFFLSQHQETQPPEENRGHFELSIIHEEENQESSNFDMNDLQSSSIA
jgi:hypothetical protein